MSAFRTGAAERRRTLIAEFRFRGVVDAAIRATRRCAHFSFSGTERLLYHLRPPRTTTLAQGAIATLTMVVIRMLDVVVARTKIAVLTPVELEAR